MDQSKIEDIIIEISTQLGILNTNTKQVLDTLALHEKRILLLEKEKGKESMLINIVPLLIRALIISLCALGTLVGAGSFIGKILNIG